MEFTRWYLVAGALLVVLVLAGSLLKRLPLSTAMIYLAAGWGLGALGWIRLDLLRDAALLERLSEAAVLISLFSTGLKLRLSLRDRLWRLPAALAFGSMAVTVGGLAALGVWALGLPLGAAVLLGAILAPTDPVLASDVQVEHPRDTDRVRFALTGEAGLNDGTAFPFVMLGLGLLGLHELGAGGWQWWAVDVGWRITGGLGVGTALGAAVARLVVWLRQTKREAVGLDDFLALGLIALTYGVAELIHVYGFLAVFAAGLALRTAERQLSAHDAAPPDVQALAAGSGDEEKTAELASHPEHAPAFMAAAVLHFNGQLERLAELGLVFVVGVLLAHGPWPAEVWWLAPVLFFVVRPLAIAPVAWWARLSRPQTGLVAWFGVRGVGSLYYLAYAITHGLPAAPAAHLGALTLAVIALSVCAHGFSVTPLMRRYAEDAR